MTSCHFVYMEHRKFRLKKTVRRRMSLLRVCLHRMWNGKHSHCHWWQLARSLCALQLQVKVQSQALLHDMSVQSHFVIDHRHGVEKCFCLWRRSSKVHFTCVASNQHVPSSFVFAWSNFYRSLFTHFFFYLSSSAHESRCKWAKPQSKHIPLD